MRIGGIAGRGEGGLTRELGLAGQEEILHGEHEGVQELNRDGGVAFGLVQQSCGRIEGGNVGFLVESRGGECDDRESRLGA